MLSGKTRLVNTRTKINGRVYDRFLIHVPSKVARDSQFPFGAGEVLRIDVDPRRKTVALSKRGEPKPTSTRRRKGKRR